MPRRRSAAEIRESAKESGVPEWTVALIAHRWRPARVWIANMLVQVREAGFREGWEAARAAAAALRQNQEAAR